MYSHTNIICKSLVIASFGLFIFPTTSALAIEIPAGITAPQSNATTIRGTVTDDTNEPLPGATIVVKGTQNGTSTDIDGNFEINVHRQGKVTLVVSYVGMKTKEVQATSGAKLDIVLETNADMLDEVIVSGFQTISRERNTGSAVVVGAEKLGKIQAPDLSSKLEGVTPGLTIYNNQMSIRGNSSFSISSTPLLVVDGQPATGMTIDDINPNTIESVTVLKDGSRFYAVHQVRR